MSAYTSMDKETGEQPQNQHGMGSSMYHPQFQGTVSKAEILQDTTHIVIDQKLVI